ncbi:Jouberin [Geodia barretti]|uniref:Jouberin n=1 Tax=Geodia barretti TaxID=519541 RepID=A0AA35WBK9_GEOBA|nr:Jouberin [Geodia barretti]
MEEKWRNIGKVCRLQLYCYPKRRRSKPLSSISEIWELWRSYKRKPYPSTLYVTLNEATPTRIQTTPTTRSMNPSQPEVGGESVEQMMGRLHTHSRRTVEPVKKLVSVPVRLPGHTCHLPTSLHSHLHPPGHATGCSVLSFSPDGHYLGAGYTAAPHKDRYTLVVYEVSTLSVVLYSDAHRGYIYSLSWSHDSHMISTASADGLVKVFSLASGDEVASLPHPCYMYTVCFIPPPPPLTPTSTLHTPPSSPLPRISYHSSLVATIELFLAQELKGHRGHVNSICVASSGEVMFSGDSVGEVMVWSREEPDKNLWCLQRAVSTQKSPAPVLSLCLHPGGKRLLVHTTTGRLAMIDLRV